MNTITSKKNYENRKKNYKNGKNTIKMENAIIGNFMVENGPSIRLMGLDTRRKQVVHHKTRKIQWTTEALKAYDDISNYKLVSVLLYIL